MIVCPVRDMSRTSKRKDRPQILKAFAYLTQLIRVSQGDDNAAQSHLGDLVRAKLAGPVG